MTQACVVARQGVGSCKHNLSLHAHVLLLDVSRTLSDEHLIERHEHEARCAVHNKAVFQRHGVVFSNDAVWTQRLRVVDTTANADVHKRCLVGQSACLKHEIFNSLVLCIFVNAGILHLSTNGYGAVRHALTLGRNEQHIVFFQRHVSHLARHDACHVNAHHLQRAVFLHAMDDSTIGERLFLQSVSMFNERADAVHLLAYVIQARTEHGTLQFYCV